MKSPENPDLYQFRCLLVGNQNSYRFEGIFPPTDPQELNQLLRQFMPMFQLWPGEHISVGVRNPLVSVSGVVVTQPGKEDRYLTPGEVSPIDGDSAMISMQYGIRGLGLVYIALLIRKWEPDQANG